MFDRKVTMSTRKKPRKVVPRLFRRIWRSFYTAIAALVNSVLRSLMVHKRRRSRQSQAGFVLPTVVMVLLVVALLTTAIVIRSFDRAKNASNIRVDQAVLNAATPALDRARAKIERLFSPEENRLTSNPPQEGLNFDDAGSISAVLSQDQYTFNDETRLKVVFDINGDGIQKKDQVKTAWKFPTDTDNNGKFDTFTLYAIYFRNPLPNENRARSPIEARARPQATGQIGQCAAAANSASVGTERQGWYETDGQLKKAFFTYVANVPIAQADITQLPATEQAKYEPYRGNQSFSGLEMQQDQGRIALDNNAVWYNDDLVISNVPPFRLNGRIHTNSNLMLANNGGDEIILYQVSALDSCYYTAENAKIIVGGHVAAGDITGDTNGNATDSTENLVEIHLYQGLDVRPDQNNVQYVNADNKTTDLNPAQIATNSNAYESRLNFLVNSALALFGTQEATDTNVSNFTRFPDEVKSAFKNKYDKNDPASGTNILKQVLTTYFAERIRRVSYEEFGVSDDPLKKTKADAQPLTSDTVFAAGSITPPIEWMRYNAADPATLPVKAANGGGIELPTTDPSDTGFGSTQQEYNIGDRIQVGNSLPRRWLKANGTYAQPKEQQPLSVPWNDQNGSIKAGTTRYRQGLVQQLDDLGDTSRGGYWERAAALSGKEFQEPAIKELSGGLRVITGAGIYIDGEAFTTATASGGTGERGKQSFLPEPPAKNGLELKQMAANDPGGIKLPPEIQNETNPETLKNYRVVWPDTMPMFDWRDNNPTNNQYDLSNGEVKKGDLQMRATVLYHYAYSAGSQQEPLACIATYYDPTSAKTAQNVNGLPQDPEHQVAASADDPNAATKGMSINGLFYPVSYASASLRASALSNIKLLRQANMLFPDGRWVNKPLRDAVVNLRDKGIDKLSLADIAAIDAANCALGILGNPTSFISNPQLDFAVKEEAFLDARQIKAIHKRDTKVNLRTGVLERLFKADLTYVDRQTTKEYINNPDKLKIAELGELNLPMPGVVNYPYYSLPIEQRQPLEVRVTQLDLDKLRRYLVRAGGGAGINNKDEYLLPNSGIIYASRDDALPDISSFDSTTGGDKGSSATDFLLDPTRRPNGILLVNGANLARKDDYRIAEKGLILATNLPVYLKSQNISANEGGFNLHFKPGTTTVREEFTDVLQPNYSNFYTRQAANLNNSFACRPNSANPDACPDGGDQWRAARILSDAVTLLSSNFRFGFRNEGDFDVNNNVGNLAVESRLNNGFWWNAFATNGEWVNPANGFPKDFDTVKAGTQGSTYVTNGVTPIQRRANFPEYKMEICRKLPVAACGPGDWKLEIPGSSAFPGTGSGTTAPIEDTNPTTNPRYVAPGDRHYPRRVAFLRNSSGQLVPDACSALAPANCKAIPIGVTGAGVPYDGTITPVPTANPNALWFWTTEDNNNPSAVDGSVTRPIDVVTLPPDVNYGNTNKLYYAPYEPEEVSERQLLLPGLPEFPREIGVPPDFPTLSLNSTIAMGSTDLTTAPSDYGVFNFDASSNCTTSKDYRPASLAPAACPAGVDQTKLTIFTVWERLLKFDQTANTSAVYIDTKDTVNPAPLVNLQQGVGDSANIRRFTLKAYAKVNIYTLPKPQAAGNADLSGVELTFDRNNRIDDPIFVLRSFDQTSSLRLINYVRVNLNGVDPNNIFWVPAAQLQIVVHPAGDPNNHQLVGNFLGSGSATSLVAFTAGLTANPAPAVPVINGGRFLGFAPGSVIPDGVMTAMTTTAEPLLIPVLNLHSPQGTPNAAPASAFGGNTINENYWVQRVPSTTTENFNAVFIMGDSPSRPFTGRTGLYSGEGGGGLANFPRFLESWQDAGTDTNASKADTKIRGSFIQFKRSIFATAPFEAIDDPQSDNSLFFDSPTVGARPDYMLSFNQATSNPYIYKGGGQLRKAPYYNPPDRLWGYDVGLLKQSPDLFARRFSTPSAGTPNEYFREVGRDDKWIATLLCAAEETPPAASAAAPTYEKWAIADPKQRPSSCQNGTPPPNQYNDPAN
jgi:type II secretory pathway pseudopilin PulG